MNISLALLVGYVSMFAYDNNLPFRITSYKESAKDRLFNTHRQGRAIDLSTKGWPELKIKELCKKMNVKFYDTAAISYHTRKPTACVYHKTKHGAYHLHIQTKELK